MFNFLKKVVQMATSQNPLTGKMSGTVGNFVATTYRGQNIIRSKAFYQKDANSEKQQKQRTVFKLMSSEYTSLASVIRLGFPNRPKNQSPYNAFMAANMPNAIDNSGEIPVIDYSKMVVSKGTLPSVNVMSVTIETEGVKIIYQPQQLNPMSSEDDEVIAMLKTTDGAVFMATKPRGNSDSENLVLPCTNVVPENVLYIYLTVVSVNRQKASQTVYAMLK